MSLIKQTLTIFIKELYQERVSKFILNSMLLVSLLLIFIVVVPFSKADIDQEIKVILLWVLFYLASINGLGQIFSKEKQTNSFFHLKLHCSSMAIFWGKALFNFLGLFTVSCSIVFIYAQLFYFYEIFSLTIMFVMFFSILSISILGTLLSALMAQANQSGVLYTIIAFPLLFPIFLLAINTTQDILTSGNSEILVLSFFVLYFLMSIALSYLVFEYIWEHLE